MENTKIEWATHTLNPWMGCTKVSPACAHCYAERDMDHRYGKVQWGPSGTRVKTADANWRKPLKWNYEAQFRDEMGAEIEKNTGQRPACYSGRPRVFCASLADIFEDWQGPIMSGGKEPCYLGKDGRASSGPSDRMTMDDLRRDLFALIDATPHLDWLLLTKRPENVRRMWPDRKNQDPSEHYYCEEPTDSRDGMHHCQPWYRKNVWLGTSVENQEYADKRIPELLKCRDLAPVLFLSCEPLLGPLDLHAIPVGFDVRWNPKTGGDSWANHYRGRINWIIAGGESGPKARPSHPDWFRGLRDQCQAAGVAFHFKQYGEWAPLDHRSDWDQSIEPGDRYVRGGKPVVAAALGIHKASSGELTPLPLKKNVTSIGDQWFNRAGKKAAGRTLDGRTWDELPTGIRV